MAEINDSDIKYANEEGESNLDEEIFDSTNFTESTQAESQPDKSKDEIFNDIFGDSDDEAREVETQEGQKPSYSPTEMSERQNFVSDFDLMMERKKASRKRVRKSKNYDIINKNDDIAEDVVSKMTEAAMSDRRKVESGELALSKLNMLSFVRSELQRVDMYETYVDHDVYSAISKWLSPLPDGSLPNIRIRTTLLSILKDWPSPSSPMLKSSGLGKIVMLLGKHPRESQENKDIARRLIANWARPIFGVTSNMGDLSREDRERQDMKHYKSMIKRRISTTNDEKNTDSKLNPGDKGFSSRARMPEANPIEYIIRPKRTSVDQNSHLTQMVKERTLKNNQIKKLHRKLNSKQKN